MTYEARQRRLHVENRLEELRTKHGLEEVVVPAWLDTYEGFMESLPAAPPAPPANGHVQPRPQQATLRNAVLDV